MIRKNGMHLILAQLFILAGFAQSTVLTAKVEYAADTDSLAKIYPDAAKGDLVIVRKDAKIFECIENGKWQDKKIEKGFSVFNESTLSLFKWNGKDWEVICANGENVRDWGAKGNYNIYAASGNDDTKAIQAAIDAASQSVKSRCVYLPTGNYYITSPLDVTSFGTKGAIRFNLRIVGEGVESSVIHAATGGIAFDASGTQNLELENFKISSNGLKNPSTVGLLLARGTGHGFMSLFIYVRNLRIFMHSDPKANKGIGTVGLWNYSAEGIDFHNLFIEANLPVCLTRLRSVPGLPADIESPFAELTPAGCSLIGVNFTGQCTLVAFDYYRPCLYIYSAGQIDLGNTYMSIRQSPGNDVGQRIPFGNYYNLIEVIGCVGFKHFSMSEGPGIDKSPSGGNELDRSPMYSYMINRLYLDQADIMFNVVGMGEYDTKSGTTIPPMIILEPFTDFFYTGIYNSRINLVYSPHITHFPEKAILWKKNNDIKKIPEIKNCEISLAAQSGKAVNIIDKDLEVVGTLVTDIRTGDRISVRRASPQKKDN